MPEHRPPEPHAAREGVQRPGALDAPHRARTRAEAQAACEQLGIEYVEEPIKRERRTARRPVRLAHPSRPIRPTRRGRAARLASNTRTRGSRRTPSSSSRSSPSDDPPPSEPPGDDAGDQLDTPRPADTSGAGR